jgi:hypothetical protein
MPWITPDGEYYDAGDNVAAGSIQVPVRPSSLHKLENSAWVLDPVKQRDEISEAIQNMLEEKARSLRYDSIDSVSKYIGFANQYQAEAISLASWAAACWAKAEEIELSVINGAPMPTVAEAMAQMPAYI